MKLKSLTLFFPAYNEEKNIGAVVTEAFRVAPELTSNFEVLVVNDGSTDRTEKVVAALQKKYPKLRLINHPQNLGYGAALATGFSNASKEWVFFSDSDRQFNLSELVRFTPFTRKFDAVIGYRVKRNDPSVRKVNAKGWNYLNRILFGLNIRDIDCAFKLFRTAVVQKVLPKTASRGAMFSAELLIRLRRRGYRVKELAVTHRPRTVGVATGAKPRVIFRAFREMALVYRGDLGHGWVKQVGKFMLVGVLNTVIDIFFYFALSRFVPLLQERKVWAKGISYSLGVLNSFVWNRSWTFKSKNVGLFSLIPFFLLSTASLGINTGVMFVSLTALKLPEVMSLILATGVTFIWSFLTSKFLIFRS